jgi:hypothetical protein
MTFGQFIETATDEMVSVRIKGVRTEWAELSRVTRKER